MSPLTKSLHLFTAHCLSRVFDLRASHARRKTVPCLPPNRIEVRVRELSQLFNVMDPSPFHEKELASDAEEFIVGWATELPADEPMSLLVHLDQHPAGDNPQKLIAEAVHHYFRYKADVTGRRLAHLTREGGHDLLRGILFLTSCVFVASLLSGFESTFMSIFRESVLIGGWVAMWRPMEVFLYERWPLQAQRKLYHALAEMPVQVRLR